MRASAEHSPAELERLHCLVTCLRAGALHRRPHGQRTGAAIGGCWRSLLSGTEGVRGRGVTGHGAATERPVACSWVVRARDCRNRTGSVRCHPVTFTADPMRSANATEPTKAMTGFRTATTQPNEYPPR